MVASEIQGCRMWRLIVEVFADSGGHEGVCGACQLHSTSVTGRNVVLIASCGSLGPVSAKCCLYMPTTLRLAHRSEASNFHLISHQCSQSTRQPAENRILCWENLKNVIACWQTIGFSEPLSYLQGTIGLVCSSILTCLCWRSVTFLSFALGPV